jgi:hypothetical protein
VQGVNRRGLRDHRPATRPGLSFQRVRAPGAHAKAHQPDRAGGVDEDIGRPDISANQAAAMHRAEGAGNADGQTQCASRIGWRAWTEDPVQQPVAPILEQSPVRRLARTTATSRPALPAARRICRPVLTNS